MAQMLVEPHIAEIMKSKGLWVDGFHVEQQPGEWVPPEIAIPESDDD